LHSVTEVVLQLDVMSPTSVVWRNVDGPRSSSSFVVDCCSTGNAVSEGRWAAATSCLRRSVCRALPPKKRN